VLGGVGSARGKSPCRKPTTRPHNPPRLASPGFAPPHSMAPPPQGGLVDGHSGLELCAVAPGFEASTVALSHHEALRPPPYTWNQAESAADCGRRTLMGTPYPWMPEAKLHRSANSPQYLAVEDAVLTAIDEFEAPPEIIHPLDRFDDVKSLLAYEPTPTWASCPAWEVVGRTRPLHALAQDIAREEKAQGLMGASQVPTIARGAGRSGHLDRPSRPCSATSSRPCSAARRPSSAKRPSSAVPPPPFAACSTGGGVLIVSPALHEVGGKRPSSARTRRRPSSAPGGGGSSKRPPQPLPPGWLGAGSPKPSKQMFRVPSQLSSSGATPAPSRPGSACSHRTPPPTPWWTSCGNGAGSRNQSQELRAGGVGRRLKDRR